MAEFGIALCILAGLIAAGKSVQSLVDGLY